MKIFVHSIWETMNRSTSNFTSFINIFMLHKQPESVKLDSRTHKIMSSAFRNDSETFWQTESAQDFFCVEQRKNSTIFN